MATAGFMEPSSNWYFRVHICTLQCIDGLSPHMHSGKCHFKYVELLNMSWINFFSQERTKPLNSIENENQMLSMDGAAATALRHLLIQTIWTDSKAMKHTNGKLGVEFHFSCFLQSGVSYLVPLHLHFLEVWVSNNLRELKQNIWLLCLVNGKKHYTECDKRYYFSIVSSSNNSLAYFRRVQLQSIYFKLSFSLSFPFSFSATCLDSSSVVYIIRSACVRTCKHFSIQVLLV